MQWNNSVWHLICQYVRSKCVCGVVSELLGSLFFQSPKVEWEVILILSLRTEAAVDTHVSCVLSLQTPYCPPDAELLEEAVEAFRCFLTWPEPYSSVCRDLLSTLMLELKAPGRLRPPRKKNKKPLCVFAPSCQPKPLTRNPHPPSSDKWEKCISWSQLWR